MKIQVLSDLHLEHGGFVPEHHPAADVIVLAGDLAPYTEGLVDQLADQWSSAPHIKANFCSVMNSTESMSYPETQFAIRFG